jgi:Spy/CpxP family protein refolding chaperone
MLKKVILLVAIVAIVASTQVFAADEAAAPTKPAPAPARERTVPAGGQGAGGGAGMGMRGMGGMGMGVWGILPQLNLTEEQKTKANDLRTAAMEKMQASGATIMAAQMKVTELVNSGATDDAIKTAAAEYNKLYVEQAIANAATMRTLRTDILKPEQVTEMDKLMKERMAQFGQRGQGGQGGGRTRGAGGAGAPAGADGAAPRAPRPANGGQN